MKKLFLIIILLVLSTNSAFAALDAAIEWEVRTTGNDNNGGGFKAGASGTDFSIQDTAERSWLPAGGTYTNDLSITDATPSVVTSASYNFVAADVGNIINLTAGTNVTTGRYEIKSVATNAATLDRDAMSGAPSADGSGYEGGGVALTGAISAIVVPGNSIYIKSGTYLETLTTSVSSNELAIQWVGYITNHSTVAYGTDRPLFDGESSRARGVYVPGVQWGQKFYNLRVTGTTSRGFELQAATLAYNCASFSNGGIGFFIDATIILACEAYSNTGVGIKYNGDASGSNFCYTHNNTSFGLQTGATTGNIIFSIISEFNSANGISSGYGSPFNCISYGNTGATTDGFREIFDFNRLRFIRNNISMNNGRYGFHSNTNSGLIDFDFNAYYGNGTAGLSGITAGANDITSDPLFTDPAANPPDFTLQSGSPCLSTGYPDTSWAVNVGLATGDYKINIGVDQDDVVAAGVGGGRRSGWSIQ